MVQNDHAATEAAGRTRRADRYHALAEELQALDAVHRAVVLDDRTPPRVGVELAGDVSAGVADLLANYNAHVDPATINVPTGNVATAFDVVVPELFQPEGNRTIRAYGNTSVSITLPRSALERSGLGVGDDVSVMARQGALLFREVDE